MNRHRLVAFFAFAGPAPAISTGCQLPDQASVAGTDPAAEDDRTDTAEPATPLPSGKVLYVRINGNSPTGSATGADASTGPYGVRVLAAPSSTCTYFSADNSSDSDYEADNPPEYDAVPTNAAVRIRC